MSVIKYDKVILKKELGDRLRMVGQEFEIANITEGNYLLRDVKTKVAIATVDIAEFEEYFEKPENMVEWTPWTAIFNKADGSVDAFYRTKGKKVQVRMLDEKSSDEKFIRAEASCNMPANDEFNLFFGISLAYERCMVKYLEREEVKTTRLLHQIKNDLKDSKRRISHMINSLE